MALSYCEADTIPMTNASTGASTYLWKIDGFPFTTEEDTSLKAGAPGFLTFELIAGNGICQDTFSRTTEVNALPLPVITPSGPISFCERDSVVIDAGVYAGYSWFPGGDTTQFLTVEATGIYTATVIDSVGCTGRDSFEANMLPAPSVLFFFSSVSPMTLEFFDLIPAGVDITWDFGDGSMDTISNPTHTYAASGTYEVCLYAIDSNGCDSTFCDSVTILIVGTTEADLNSKVTVYPNPATQQITVEVDPASSSPFQLIMRDNLGRKLMDKQRLISTTTLPVNQFSPGFYYLEIKGESIHEVRKIQVGK